MKKEPDNKSSENEQEQPTEKQPIGIRYATYVYAALALCVLTVLAVSIISASRVPDIDVSLPDYSQPSVLHDVSRPAREDDKPVIDEVSGIPADTSEPPVIAKVSFELPSDGEIIKGYSVTRPVFSETMGDYRIHSGVDIASEVGSGVLAYSDGTIAEIKNDPLMGTTVVIAHDGGVKSVYANLSETLAEGIRVGAAVKAGDIIGAVGDTAKVEAADEPHLHFELLLDDKPINPEKELNAIRGS